MIDGLSPGLTNAQISCRVYPYGGLPVQWAVVFTDATANAAFLNNIRALESDGLPIRRQRRDLFKLNGFIGYRAHLFAGDTTAAARPWQAAIAIDISMPNHLLAFIFES